MLAPAAAYRDLIGPRPAERSSPSNPTAPRTSSAHRSTWAELLKRVLAIDVLECPYYAGRRKLIALIHDGPVVRKILDHLGIPTEPPRLAAARVGEELVFDL